MTKGALLPKSQNVLSSASKKTLVALEEQVKVKEEEI